MFCDGVGGHEAKYPFTDEQQGLIAEMLDEYAAEFAKPDMTC